MTGTASDIEPVLSPQERRQRNRDEMVTAILAAARGVMRERGVAALSLREVARRVRLRAPSLYAYFPSKAGLYDGLFLMGIQRYSADRDRCAQVATSFWDYLQATFVSYMQFALDHPDLYQLAFERPIPGFIPSEESMAESAKLLAGFESMVAGGIAEGSIKPHVPLHQARDLFIAVSHGLTSQHMANEPNLPVGSGRFGSLIPVAMEIFRAAWDPTFLESRRDINPRLDADQ